jgi:hypothetical protein
MKLAILFASRIAWSRSSAQNVSNRMLLHDNTYRNDGTRQIYERDDSQDPHAGRITTSLLSQFSHDGISVLCLSLKALKSEQLLVEIVAVQALQERRNLAVLGNLALRNESGQHTSARVFCAFDNSASTFFREHATSFSFSSSRNSIESSSCDDWLGDTSG